MSLRMRLQLLKLTDHFAVLGSEVLMVILNL